MTQFRHFLKLAGFFVLTFPVMCRGTDASAAAAAKPLAAARVASSASKPEVAEAETAADKLADCLIKLNEMPAGICSLPRVDDGGELAFALARDGRMIVHGMNPDKKTVAILRHSAWKQWMLGKNLYFDVGTPPKNPFADRFVDLLVMDNLCDADIAALPVAEIMRVLAPRGRAILGRSSRQKGPGKLNLGALARRLGTGAQKLRNQSGVWCILTKPPLEGADNWGHWARSADNNPMSHDRVIRAPYQTQWMELPYYAASPSMTLASEGRVFLVSGPAGKMDYAEVANKLYARNGYNGTLLWQRDLHWSGGQGWGLHQLVAIEGSRVALAEGAACLVLDAQTGNLIRKITWDGITAPLTWIGMDGSTLLAAASLVAPSRAVAPVATPVAASGTVLAAYDLDARKALWTKPQEGTINPALVAARQGRLAFWINGCGARCLETRSGKQAWMNDAPELLKLMARPAGQRGRGGLGNGPGLVMTDRCLYLRSPAQTVLAVLAQADGKLLTSYQQAMSNLNVFWSEGDNLVRTVIRDSAGARAVRLDPETGQVLGDAVGLPANVVRCDRWIGVPGDAMFIGHALISVYRSDCGDGLIPANGLLYAMTPGSCRCSYVNNGVGALTPASDSGLALRDGPGKVLVEPGYEEVTPLSAAPEDGTEAHAGNIPSRASKVAMGTEPALVWRQDSGERQATAPASANGRIFFGRDNGAIECLEANTGKIIWDFETGGQLRATPTIWQGRLYAGSLDGWVYCLEAASGRLLWSYSPASRTPRFINFFGRLGSTWPVNTGILVQDGVAYGAAGFNGRDGYCAFALDARSGKILWETPCPLPISADERVALSIRGGLTVVNGKLYVGAICQAGVPACFDLKTGRLLSPQFQGDFDLHPLGKEIGLLGEKWLYFGGNLQYAPLGEPALKGYEYGRPYTLSFVRTDETGGNPVQVQPLGLTTIPPTWDDDMLVVPALYDGNLYAWDTGMFLQFLDKIRAGEMVKYGKTVQNDGKPTRLFGLPDEQFWPGTATKMDYSSARWGPVAGLYRGVALAANGIICLVSDETMSVSRSQHATTNELAGRTWFVRWLDRKTGEKLWEAQLPSLPLTGGLCLDADGRIIVTLQDGEVMAFQGKR